jgi:hypothetical protein
MSTLSGDLQPLCLVHRVSMNEDEITEELEPNLRTQVYSCGESGCDLNWEFRLGYFKRSSVTRTFQFGIEGRRCPTYGHCYLYLSSFEIDGNRRYWRCPVKGCVHGYIE